MHSQTSYPMSNSPREANQQSPGAAVAQRTEVLLNVVLETLRMVSTKVAEYVGECATPQAERPQGPEPGAFMAVAMVRLGRIEEVLRDIAVEVSRL